MSWDLFCKALLKECGQDFVTYLAPGARYIGMREGQVQTRAEGPFEPREMRGDGVIEAWREDLPFLIDVEWQSTKDGEMDERLLGYSYEMTRLHGLPVLSAVLYTQPVSGPPRAPLVRSIPGERARGGSPALWFDFVSLEICKQTVETFRALDLDAFSVLMLLCEDGGTPAILEEVLERLLRNKDKRRESIAAALFFASQVLKSEEYRRFWERKYEMLQEELQDNLLYQAILKSGFEKGIVQGVEEGRVEGRVEEAHKLIVLFAETRFPDLLTWVQTRVEQISDLQTLQEITVALFRANTPEEVQQAFTVSLARGGQNTIH